MKPLAATAFAVCLYPITAFAANFDQADRYDWSGYSFGVFAGGAAGDIHATELRTDAFGGNSWFPPDPGRDYDFHASGLTAGGQVGWDMQRDNMVFGIGGEVGVLDLNASGGARTHRRLPRTTPPRSRRSRAGYTAP